MKSFPSTANESKNMYGSTESQSLASTFDISRIKALNLNSSVPVLQEMLKEQNINAGNYQMHIPMHTVNVNYMTGDDGNKPEYVLYEDPLHLPNDVIALAKDYEWVYKYQIKSLLGMGEKKDNSIKTQMANVSAVPSMFNPMYGVNALGMIRNTPLLNDIEDYGLSPDIDDCSIRTLCALSKSANSELGLARYKYADFMYCKDLGKVANNHLITLRKFAHPVADHIFEMASPKYVQKAGTYSWKNGGDVGRLVSWFGTDDNKLEDICKYSYSATWKELNAQIEEKDSKADDKNTGILGMISNSFNPVYNTATGRGETGNHSIWGWLGAQLTPAVFQGIGSNNELLRNYDNNKVYTPRNTVQQNHIYEGKLIFSHEFTLNFSYKLRAYDNINPRSAFTDLIGNILEVTYRRGKFWGGSRKLIGPAQDVSTFDKAYAMVDKSFDMVGGFLASIMENGINFKDILGHISSGAAALFNNAKELVSGNGSEIVENLKNGMSNILSNTAFTEAAKGYIKNSLGRPQYYAWQSFLSGDDVGLWHVTIGNPRNPILSIGNLIMTNATVTHTGPLGVDDFPTELRVSVTLKHARPRDITDIGRMYTKGASAIYQVMAGHKISDFWSEDGGENVGKTDAEGADEYKMVKAQTTEQRNNQIMEETKSYNDSTRYDLSFSEFKYNGSQNALSRRDPKLWSPEEISVMRKNTYSDAIFRMMLDETA